MGAPRVCKVWSDRTMIRIQSYALSLMIVILFTGCGSGSTVTSTNSGTGGSGSGSSIISGVLPLGPATQFNTNRTSFTFNTSTGSMSVQSTGVPFHPTGPFTINPVQNQNFNQSFPLRGGLNEPNLNPVSTPLGPIGIAINGVPAITTPQERKRTTVVKSTQGAMRNKPVSIIIMLQLSIVLGFDLLRSPSKLVI